MTVPGQQRGPCTAPAASAVGALFFPSFDETPAGCMAMAREPWPGKPILADEKTRPTAAGGRTEYLLLVHGPYLDGCRQEKPYKPVLSLAHCRKWSFASPPLLLEACGPLFRSTFPPLLSTYVVIWGCQQYYSYVLVCPSWCLSPSGGLPRPPLPVPDGSWAPG